MASQNINSLLGSVTKLNYHDWKFVLGMIFWHAGTWKVVSGAIEKPKASQQKELEGRETAAEDRLCRWVVSLRRHKDKHTNQIWRRKYFRTRDPDKEARIRGKSKGLILGLETRTKRPKFEEV
ncbi:uncharacterized protein BT62DRAFT_923376 [Guyanagaster necrorhizus]|uniref:Uncharacterized protein n=1 Tax=Guyanagaster necrorhizus TaxID=856835 RepID=A0A9P8AN62_9AGAR|nr:uncharacterized protein BT62DRAFT_923376 [Guyanagaster necrorhizus MCA 3950]KAG7441426.1 hypothetical protein BT62DRAFT_923376 [Guyanagaster necrorhizus MCA 3950]